MGKRLIVAEKPSVGRDIAKVLNCKDQLDGAIGGENDIVTWAFGHLASQCYPEEMDEKYKEWTMEDLPIIPKPFQLKVLEGGEKQFGIIKSYMDDPQIDRVVCATDAGREGELIFRYIYQLADCSKPVDRLWISSLTYSAIKSGFENLKNNSEYDALYQSARCRSEADWLVGINGSRAFAIANDMRGLSVGRVLSPTLAILVQRELERRNFIPEEYCELIATFDGWEGRLVNPTNQELADGWSRFPIERKDELQRVVASKPLKARIEDAINTEECVPPQQLYDLTSLQRDANRIYSYSSKHTLDIAQKLYERYKAITYPRTDSRYLSSDIKSTLNKRLESLCGGELDTYARQALQSEKDLFGRFILNAGVSDHHAIIPTGEAKDWDNWSAAEKRIFDLIARRFIGMFMPDRTVLRQTIQTVIEDKQFLSYGEKVLSAGWSDVDTSRKSNLKELPDYEIGDFVSVQSMRVRTDETKPPAPHTEASLLNAMEHAGTIVEDESESDHETEFGIGTPATRAATIEKLVEKQMAIRNGRALIPTEYGIKLVEILPDYLCSPEMTGGWEAKLNRISKGNEDPDRFMDDIRKLTVDLVNEARKKSDTGINNADAVGECPLCGQKVKEYPEAYYCVNKDCDFRRIWKARRGFHPTLKADTMKALLQTGKAETEKGIYRLIKEEPYIEYERFEEPEPQFKELLNLITDYGLNPVDKTGSGGSLWFRGDWGDELMSDFVSDCSEIGCFLKYSKDSRALKHNSGWYLSIGPKYKDAYDAVMKKQKEKTAEETKSTLEETPQLINEDDPVISLIQESGFPFVDKREKGGSLWIIADKEESRELIKRCAEMGVGFAYSRNGSRSTDHKPGWYST
ncbi:MAG: DNA topoisomerase 3 [Firmicutes bacterium]|nr:DNA topoisomerase 3 [Bacillota bacterium]